MNNRKSKDDGPVAPYFIIALIIIMVVVMISLLKSTKYLKYTEEQTATYQGYLIKGDKYYPIVEIGNNEYISKTPQEVRDLSYKGEEIVIYAPDDTVSDFVIKWRE